MKNTLLLFLFSFLLWGCGYQKTNTNLIEINQNWQFRQAGTDEWLSASVPGCVHSDLRSHNLIDQEVTGANEQSFQWIEKEDWEYKTEFNITPEQLQYAHNELTFEGLDTYADVFLNDTKILTADNMFRSWNIDVNPLLKEGKNTLCIYFHSPVKIGMEKLKAYPYHLEISNELAPVGEQTNIFTRKAPFHFGWDWGPRLVTSGIWRPVFLKGWNKSMLRDIYFKPKNITESKAEYNAELEIESDIPLNSTYAVVNINGKSGEKIPININAGSNEIDIPFTIDNPKLWWCNGLGEAYLYNVSVDIYDGNKKLSTIKRRLGVRTIEIEQKNDEWGQSFQVVLNGKPVFMKGTNYIPSRTLTTEVTPELYEQVLQDAIKANMNMIRVWGGAIYEEDYFYNRCDELGLLIWQDFMFACAMTPDDDSYVENVRLEAEENVKRLRNHPCLALWCGNNENLRAHYDWGWIKNTPEQYRQRVIDTYNTLYHVTLKEAVKKEDPQCFYWASSPQSAEGKLSNRSSGDDHDWTVWFGEIPYEAFNESFGRFVSEYGLQSVPDVRTLATFVPSDQMSLSSPALHYIQRSKMPWIAPDRDGNGQIEWYINNYYRKAKDFEATSYLSQLVQAETMRYAIEVHRQNMPRCMGSLYWQINDCWPTISWSSVDYFGRWKASHYFTREAYKEIILSAHFYNDTLTVYAINDGEELPATLHLELFDLKGKKIEETHIPATIKGNASTLCFKSSGKDFLKGQKTDDAVLIATLSDDNGIIAENNCYFAKTKNLQLIKPDIRYEIKKDDKGYNIELSTNVLAKNVYIKTANEGFLSNNFFDLYPNRPVTISFEGNEAPEITKVYSVTDSF
ncbi:MAG: glycoside hydrolase family 2 protein [Bacteroidales bacterium]|nr:glycoside hydrolase family 2 protein [Bacteroidales bacterium]